MNSKPLLLATVTLFGSMAVSFGQNPGTNESVVAEVTIKDEGKTARISVYLLNKSKDRQTLFSGRVGTSRSGKFDPVDFDEIVKKTSPYGNGALVVPELTFGAIQFSAPTTVAWGATFRNMLPTLIELEKDERLFYCVFSVPSPYVQNEFISGRLQFPGVGRTNEKVPSLEVPVIKCSREK